MDLQPYVDSVRRDLATAAEAGGPEARDLGERLTAPLEAALRLALLDALSAAAAEITRDLAPGSVDLRLRGREPSFVVTPPPTDHWADDLPETPTPPARSGVDSDDGAVARINVRLGEDLKARIEEAAREAGLSVNAWIIRMATTALAPEPRRRRSFQGGERFTGWVQ